MSTTKTKRGPGRPRIAPSLRSYRPRLSAELEGHIKAAAALAHLTVDDYWQRVVTPLVRDDLARRMRQLELMEPTDAQ
jgi:hypothetical protein